jgi:hypothetical protein
VQLAFSVVVYFTGYWESITNNPPNYWVIRGRSDQNDWERMLVPGKSNHWHSAKLPRGLESGDRIFCWESGAPRRMVGLAELVSPNTGQNEDGETLFEVRYLTHRFAVMPTIKELRQVPVVENASFLKLGPATTILNLTQEQGEALYQFLSVRNPDCARIWPDIVADLSAHFLPDLDGDFTALEGASGRVDHLRRERSRELVDRKKRAVLMATNRLECEACGFDFAGVYGPRGSNFCEVHHLQPLSDVHSEVETLLEDLAIVCSNCHRMLHREPWTDIPGLRASLQHS